MGEARVLDICERTFAYGVRVVSLCRYLEKRGWIGRKIGWQLLSSGTSVGANVEEGQGAHSKKDFIAKYTIALKESRESVYWMRMSVAVELITEKKVNELLAEGIAICKILGKSIITARLTQRKRDG